MRASARPCRRATGWFVIAFLRGMRRLGTLRLWRQYARRAVGPVVLCRASATMGRPMTRPATIPAGSWPLEMRAETAAAYCDEPSVDAFLAKVQRGVYCAPTREKGCLPKWHRLKLDRDIARRHGLRFDNVAVAEDVTELI